jgi:hypothetical protein
MIVKAGNLQEALEEATAKEILQGVDPEFLSHSQRVEVIRKMGVQYRGTKGDTVTFESHSASEPGKNYTQTIKMLGFRQAMRQKDANLRSRVRDSVLGDLKVHCTGPAFKFWGYQYIITRLGAALVPERRKPDVRNPARRGLVCKHLDAVLKAFPFWISNITSDLKKQGYE